MYNTNNQMQGLAESFLLPKTQKVYERVNWNAKSKDGTYPCRKNPCYDIDFVNQILSIYKAQNLQYIPGNIEKNKLVLGIFDWCGKDYDEIDDEDCILSKHRGRVEAILYENYWVENGKSTNSKKKTKKKRHAEFI